MRDSSRLTINTRGSSGPNTLQPTRDAMSRAGAVLAAWDGYRPTELREFPGLARHCAVRSIHLKLEQTRFDTGSFKALGPPYALAAAIERSAEPIEVAVAATSGNHGRALAWGARRLGVECIIVMPAHVSAGREKAIRAFGASVVRVDGDFDAALAEAERIGHRSGHRLIADLVGSDGPTVAHDILAGYSLLAHEVATALAPQRATHVFVAAGNGSLAAATSHRFANMDSRQPRIVSIEPLAADAVRRSLELGGLASVAAGNSVMDGLVTASPSRIAWPILSAELAAGMSIADDWAVEILRGMAAGRWGDPPLEMGETGVAAVAGLIEASRSTQYRSQLGIDGDSRLVAIVCEGVTDRDVFDGLVRGETPLPDARVPSTSTQGNAL